MEIKKQKRTPIVLNKNSVALLHIFTRNDLLDDMWTIDIGDDYYEIIKNSAKQFINQLEGQECDLFLEELGIEALNQFKKNREKVGETIDLVALLKKRE